MVEVLVAVVVVVALGLTVVSVIANIFTHWRVERMLNNMKQLHLATQQMTLDNETTEVPLVRWTCSGTAPLSFDQSHHFLVPAYLTEEDFQKLLTVGDKGFWGTRKVENAMTVFAVCDEDTPNTVLFASKNWHGMDKPLAGEPYGTKRFVIFHKAGDGAVLLQWQSSDTNVIGSGGMHNYLPLK